MLTLKDTLKLDRAAMQAADLTDRFCDDDLARIGTECAEGYLRDEQSRAPWMKRNEAGMDLALQISKDKNFPWPGCSNVAFPLVTIAALQFHARAYPALINGNDIVKCNVFGDDPTGEATAKAKRVGTHMSWQLLHEDTAWEEQEDKAILNLSIIGTTFKKTYRNPSLGHNVSELVLAKDLVVDYWAKSLSEAARKTHRIPKHRNEVRENILRGIWRDVSEEGWFQGPPTARSSEQQAGRDNRQGLVAPRPDDASTYLFLEQHCNLDLDGDGYAEPYIVTFEKESRCVVRIVTGFDGENAIERVALGPNKGQIIRIAQTQFFTKKSFIPSPDGGFYDIGFGVFLGPLNESVNSLVNMLLDSGTMQTTAGGFLGRGAKIRGGTQSFSPFEWKRVDATGDDLRKSILPLPVNAPSDVLFQLLALLIQFSSRVAGTTDTTVGENPGQNTPAQSMQTMVEMGQKIYTAIFKRLWRSSREEFQKLFLLNGIYMSLDDPSVGGATRVDYLTGVSQIAPVADPNVTSETMNLQRALTLKQAAMSTSGYNLDEVERRFLRALRVEGIDTVFQGTANAPPQKDPAVALQEVKSQGDLAVKQLDNQMKAAALQVKQMELKLEAEKFVAELMEEQRLNNAKIMELGAKAAESAANAQSEQAYAQVAIVNAELARVRMENEHLDTQIEHVLRAAEIKISAQQRSKE